MRVLAFAFALALAAPAASAQIMSAGPLRPATASPPADDAPQVVYRFQPSWGTPRGISGRSGSHVKEGRADHRWSSTSPLFRIEMGEKSDKPCMIRMFWSWHTGHNDSDVFESCSGSATSRSKRRVGASSVPQGSPRAAIRGLQVCSNNRNGSQYRVKGLRVWMATVTETGDGVVTNGGREEFERANCRRWETRRMCPAGEVVVSLDVHYQQNANGPEEITGLAPRCAAPYRHTVETQECRAGGC